MTEDEFLRRTEKREVKEKLAFVSKKKETSKELCALIETKENQILKLQSALDQGSQTQIAPRAK